MKRERESECFAMKKESIFERDDKGEVKESKYKKRTKRKEEADIREIGKRKRKQVVEIDERDENGKI